jgi:uncharacterized protein
MNIEEIKKSVVDALMPMEPEKIILFGSYAYGSPDQNSDLDICVVEKEYESKILEKRKIRELLRKIPVPKDILNPTLDEYEFYCGEINSVYYDIERKGIVLWQKNS